VSYYEWKKMVRESALFLIFLSFISIFAGVTLERQVELLSHYPTIVLIVPAFIGLCGGIASTFSCRLTSALRLGKYDLRKRKGKLVANAGATLTVTVIVFIALALVAYGLGLAFSLGAMPPFLNFMLATVLSAVVVVGMSMFLAVGVALFAIRKRLDPDNFESPVLTTFSDLAGVISFICISSLIII
jgi:mgtE-like transporter